MTRPIVLWTRSTPITNRVDEALASLAPRRPTFGRVSAEGARGFSVKAPTSAGEVPRRAAFVVTTGSGKAAERFALTLGAMALVLPEAADYLLRKAEAATPAEPLVLVGFDLRPGK